MSSGLRTFRQAKRKLASSTTRCVDFVVVRIINDFPLRDEPGCGFGELLEQHDRQGKVAAGKHATMLFAREDVDLREVTVREAGSSHHDMRTVLERGQDISLGGVRLGVLDKDVAGGGERLRGRGVYVPGKERLAHYPAGMLSRDRSDKIEVRGPRNPACKLGTRPTGCARQTYFEHHLACFQVKLTV